MEITLLQTDTGINLTNDVKSKIQKITSERNGKCLSKNYKDKKQKFLWECENGHKWRTTLSSVLYSGSWCPVCAGNRKLSLTEMQQIAFLREGKCLAVNYVNSKTKLLWQCKFGHQWSATAFSIKTRESWCPQCARNLPYGIETMVEMANSKKGKCLSKGYTNCKTKMAWECIKGHQFLLSSESVKAGKWCPFCDMH